MGLAPSKYPPKNQTIRSSLAKYVIWEIQVRTVKVIWGVNGVAMDRHGLILWENEATGSRRDFQYLPDLREAKFQLKINGILHISKKYDFCIILAIPNIVPFHSGRVGGMGCSPLIRRGVQMHTYAGVSGNRRSLCTLL